MTKESLKLLENNELYQKIDESYKGAAVEYIEKVYGELINYSPGFLKEIFKDLEDFEDIVVCKQDKDDFIEDFIKDLLFSVKDEHSKNIIENLISRESVREYLEKYYLFTKNYVFSYD